MKLHQSENALVEGGAPRDRRGSSPVPSTTSVRGDHPDDPQPRQVRWHLWGSRRSRAGRWGRFPAPWVPSFGEFRPFGAFSQAQNLGRGYYRDADLPQM